MAEAGTLAGALDQPRDVRDDELALVAFEHAEHRRERRERIVGDLRRGAGQAREQRGLAGVGEADEADVGEQLQRELDPALLTAETTLGEAWRLARGSGEALVALAAAAAAGERRGLAVGEQLPAAPEQVPLPLLLGSAAAENLRPGRDPDREGLAVGSMALGAAAVPAAPGAVVRAAPEALQVAQRLVADEHDVTSAPAVASVGTAARDVRFAAEARTAVAAGAGLYVNPRAIVKHVDHRDSTHRDKGSTQP